MYDPNPTQATFHDLARTNRWTAFFGGVRCGKSRAGIEHLIALIQTMPGIKVLITRKFEEDLVNTCMADFHELCPTDLILYMKQRGKLILFNNGSMVLFKGLYTRQGRTQKIGSLTFGAIMIEEAEELTEDDFLLVKARLSQPKIPDVERRGILLANPPTIGHWLYKQFGPVKPEGHASIHGKTRDNLAHVGSEYLKELESTYPQAWRQRFLDGEFGVSFKGTPVIHGFTPTLHVQGRAVDPHLPLLRSWDFGYNRPCVTFWQYTGTHWHWFETLLGHRIHLREFIPQVVGASARLAPGQACWDTCDIAGRQRRDNADQTSIEILQSYKIFPINRKVASAYDGVDLIQKAVSQGHLTVDPSNTYGVECLAGGWQVEKSDRDRYVVIDDGIYIHMGDTLRYLFVNYFAVGPSIEDTTVDPVLESLEEAERMKTFHGNEDFTLDECLRALQRA